MNIKETKPERRALLELLARFEITAEQATRFWLPENREVADIDHTDANLLANPTSSTSSIAVRPTASACLSIGVCFRPPAVRSTPTSASLSGRRRA